MTIADKARDAAIHCEMKKVAYRQTKDGIVVSFVLHPNEVPTALSTSHIGARYIAALVEIGDDEQPINPAEKEIIKSFKPPVSTLTAKPQPNAATAGAKRLSMIAALRCGDATFRAFLREECFFDTQDKDQAAVVVRQLCKVESRKEFDADPLAALRWHSLNEQFLAWQAKERVGV